MKLSLSIYAPFELTTEQRDLAEQFGLAYLQKRETQTLEEQLRDAGLIVAGKVADGAAREVALFLMKQIGDKDRAQS